MTFWTGEEGQTIFLDCTQKGTVLAFGFSFESFIVFKRQVLRSKNQVHDTLIFQSPQTKKYVEATGIAEIDSEGMHAFYSVDNGSKSELFFSGEPWKWTSSKGVSITNGKRVESEAVFTPTGTVQTQKIFSKDGKEEIEMKTEGTIVYAEKYEQRRAELLNQ